MGIVDYLAQEGFLGDDFNRLLSNCALQGDIEALHIFVKHQSQYFTVLILLLPLLFSSMLGTSGSQSPRRNY
jgi:hypothetical protein